VYSFPVLNPHLFRIFFIKVNWRRNPLIWLTLWLVCNLNLSLITSRLWRVLFCFFTLRMITYWQLFVAAVTPIFLFNNEIFFIKEIARLTTPWNISPWLRRLTIICVDSIWFNRSKTMIAFAFRSILLNWRDYHFWKLIRFDFRRRAKLVKWILLWSLVYFRINYFTVFLIWVDIWNCKIDLFLKLTSTFHRRIN